MRDYTREEMDTVRGKIGRVVETLEATGIVTEVDYDAIARLFAFMPPETDAALKPANITLDFAHYANVALLADAVRTQLRRAD